MKDRMISTYKVARYGWQQDPRDQGFPACRYILLHSIVHSVVDKMVLTSFLARGALSALQQQSLQSTSSLSSIARQFASHAADLKSAFAEQIPSQQV